MGFPGIGEIRSIFEFGSEWSEMKKSNEMIDFMVLPGIGEI